MGDAYEPIGPTDNVPEAPEESVPLPPPPPEVDGPSVNGGAAPEEGGAASKMGPSAISAVSNEPMTPTMKLDVGSSLSTGNREFR